MTRPFRGRALTLAALGLATACGQPARQVRRIEVEISGFVFKPGEVRVAVGDTIVWINRDIVPHTATAVGAFDTGNILRNDSARTVVTGTGRIRYVCALHPTMEASLTLP